MKLAKFSIADHICGITCPRIRFHNTAIYSDTLVKVTSDQAKMTTLRTYSRGNLEKVSKYYSKKDLNKSTNRENRIHQIIEDCPVLCILSHLFAMICSSEQNPETDSVRYEELKEQERELQSVLYDGSKNGDERSQTSECSTRPHKAQPYDN